jgi:hypothetical protein
MSDDLVKRLRLQSETSLMRLPTDHVYASHADAADHIEKLEAALREIANPDTWEGMDWVGDGSPRWIARAALEKKDD